MASFLPPVYRVQLYEGNGILCCGGLIAMEQGFVRVSHLLHMTLTDRAAYVIYRQGEHIVDQFVSVKQGVIQKDK